MCVETNKVTICRVTNNGINDLYRESLKKQYRSHQQQKSYQLAGRLGRLILMNVYLDCIYYRPQQ